MEIKQDSVALHEVIICTKTRRGTGRDKNSPIRIVLEVYTKEGELIAEKDPVDEGFVMRDLIHFAEWILSKNLSRRSLNPTDVNSWLESIENKKGID